MQRVNPKAILSEEKGGAMIAERDFIEAIRSLVFRRLKAGHEDQDVHMDLQRAFVEAGGYPGVNYQLHASGKPRAWWQKASHC